MEGAGGPYGLNMEQRTDELTCIFCTRYTFLSLSCSLDDEVLCSFDDDGNVVLGVEEVKADVNKDKSVYDLQGRRLNVEPSHLHQGRQEDSEIRNRNEKFCSEVRCQWE